MTLLRAAAALLPTMLTCHRIRISAIDEDSRAPPRSTENLEAYESGAVACCKAAGGERRRSASLCKVEVELAERDATRLRKALADADFRRAAMQLLREYVLDLERYPALRSLAWSRSDRWVTAPEALALYERNWRHVDKETWATMSLR